MKQKGFVFHDIAIDVLNSLVHFELIVQLVNGYTLFITLKV